MAKKILVGTDFSAAGERALQTAAAWARRDGAALRIVHVVPPSRWLVGLWRTDDATVAIHVHAVAELKRRVEALDPERSLEISTGVVSGAASAVLLDTVREFDADLLVVGARGEHAARNGVAGLGGTAIKLLAASPVPLLFVRTAAHQAPASVLAAVDLSPLSRDVVAAAAASVAENGRLTVFHVCEAPFAARLSAYGLAGDTIEFYTEGEEQRARREMEALVTSLEIDVDVRYAVERGDPIDALFRQFEPNGPDLVVLGRQGGRRGRASAAPGGVARDVVSAAPTDVLVVPPGGG